ncbi:MAG: hypothetical protein V2A71_07495 [Candidatus Eisenbacteria bacterium]
MWILLLSVKGLSFSPVSSWYLLLGLALLLTLLVLYVYPQRTARLSPTARRALVALRIAAFLCVICALLEPSIVFESEKADRPRVFVLVDNSASMGLPSGEAGVSRYEMALRAAESLVKKLPRAFEREVFVFSDTLAKVDEPVGASAGRIPAGERSALGEALEKVAVRAENSPAAVVLISDGASSHGPDPSGVAKRLLLPVYTVSSAKEVPLKDVEISEVLHPAVVYGAAEVSILVRIKGRGLENLSVPLSVSEGGKVLTRTLVKLTGQAESEVPVAIKPGSPGVHFYTVSIPEVSGEASTVNNSASIALEALAERFKVVYVEGALSWDFTFLKRELESDPKLDVRFVFASDSKAKIPTLKGVGSSLSAEGRGASVVIVGDGAVAHMRAEDLRGLERFVESGGGLFLVGAEGLDQAGEFASRLLPVGVRRPGAGEAVEYVDSRITFEGLSHPVCEIERDASTNAESWRNVSPLVGRRVIERTGPGAAVLVEGTLEGERFPLIVAGRHGRGRVMFAAASGLWRWGFTLPGVGGSERLFSRFVSNAVQWLAEGARETAFEARPLRWVFENGEEVAFRVTGVKSAADFSLELADSTGGSHAARGFEESGDTVTVSFGVLGPGEYSYRVSGGRRREALSLSGKFLVDSMGAEHRNLASDPQLLRYISEASGGKYFEADQAKELAREVEVFGQKARVDRQVKLWNHPVLFLLFTALLGFEWWLRRRSGLP